MPKPRRFSKKKIWRFKQKNSKASSSSSSSEPPPPPSPSPSPPWVELPREITADILHRLGALEILNTAQRVCTTWWKVCKDPSMWRVIDTRNSGYVDDQYDLDAMCRIAVDRSQGLSVKINIEHFGDRDLLNYIAQRSSQLRHLRLVRCCSNGGLAAVAKIWPLLEELHLNLSFISKADIIAVGRSCPRLKSFTLNDTGFRGLGTRCSHCECNDQALAIAENMPELRHLALFGNIMTNEGLCAILDGCPHLQSLDLRRCFSIELEGDLGKRCSQQIIELKRPHDSTIDYEFNAHISDYYSDSEYDPWDYNYDYDYNDFEYDDYTNPFSSEYLDADGFFFL